MKDLSTRSRRRAQKTQHYGLIAALYRAFFSPDLYIDVVRRWRGFGLLYMLLMLSVFVMPYAVKQMFAYQHLIQEKLILPIQQLPPFVVRAGEVHLNGPMPYLVKNQQDEVIAIVDTSGRMKQLPSKRYPDAAVLVTKRAIHFDLPSPDFIKSQKFSEKKIKSFRFSPTENIHFVGADWLEDVHLKGMADGLSYFLYPTAWMLYAGIYFPILFSFAFLGQFLARFIFKVHLSYQAAARLLAVAATPQALIYFILLTFDVIYPGTGLLYFGLTALYFSFGVLAYRQDSRGMVLQ